jgi:hypothetical protein
VAGSSSTNTIRIRYTPRRVILDDIADHSLNND